MYGYVDIIMGILEIKNEMIESFFIDNLFDFVCVCGEKSLLVGFEKMFLYNFYVVRYVVYYLDMFFFFNVDSIDLFKSSMFYVGCREIGYYSDLLFGVIGVVEKSDMVVILSGKIVIYFRDVWCYNIKILCMFDEIIFCILFVYVYLVINSIYYKNVKKLILIFQLIFFFSQEKQFDVLVEGSIFLCD